MTEMDPQTRLKKLARIRWTAVIVYVGVVMFFSFLPLLIQIDDGTFAWVLTIIVVVGMVPMLIILSYPFFKNREMDQITKDPLDEALMKVDISMPWYNAVHMKVLYWIFGIMIPVMAIMMAVVPLAGVLISNGLIIILLVVILAIFGKLDVECDKEMLVFGYGPFKKKIPITEIVSVKAVEVHALRDFMGYGVRLGPEGAIGYIAGGNEGIWFQIQEGKKYVITIGEPDTLVFYIKAAMVQSR